MLALDHGLIIVPENDLGICIVFRFQNVNRLVGVNGVEPALRQLPGNAGAQ